MEPRANHFLIGVFAIGVTALAFIFIMWLARVQIAAQYAYYDVKFSDGVAGLPVGGEVRYNGVKVGTVESIRFSPLEPGAVYVGVKIENRDDFTIREDAQASLEFLGITGLTYVLITGGSVDSRRLEVQNRPTGERPVIVAKPSAIQQLFVGVPELMAEARVIVDDLQDVLSTENKAAFSATLSHFEEISGSLAGSTEDIETVITSVREMSVQLESLASGANRLLSEDGEEVIAKMLQAAEAYERLAVLGEAVLAENREALNDFTGQGLTQLSSLVVEARELIRTLDRMAQRVESDPATFFLGPTEDQEIEVPR